MNAEKHLHFDFKSVRVCYFNIDLGMSSLSNNFSSNIYIRDSQLNRPESVSLASLARQ